MLTTSVVISAVVSWIYGNTIRGQRSDLYRTRLLQRIFLSVRHLRPLVRGCMVYAATLPHEQLYGIYTYHMSELGKECSALASYAYHHSTNFQISGFIKPTSSP